MFLRQIGQRYNRAPFMAFNHELQEFEASTLRGRIAVADRSLATRERTLFASPDAVIPDGRTIRNVATGETFLVGRGAKDSLGYEVDEDEPAVARAYNQMYILHEVTDRDTHGSSGIATLHRRVPQGDEDSPGWLEETEVGRFWVDLVYRSAAQIPDVYEKFEERHILYMSSDFVPQEDDFFDLKGDRYRVAEVFPEDGFTKCRVDHQTDHRGNFVIIAEENRRYDRELQKYVSDQSTYPVTGYMIRGHDFAVWSSDAEDYVDISIDSSDIGIVPEPGMRIMYSATKRVRTIEQVDRVAGNLQYRLRCR